jgi:uncharacterized protein
MSRPPADFRSAHPSSVSARAADWLLDATVMAHGRLTWEHEFQNVAFPRLRDVALSDRPTVSVRLQFSIDEQHPVVAGELRGEVELTCQRCMKPMRHSVHEQFELMLVASEEEATRIPERYEPWVTNVVRADVFELVEEQLLLALPLIAKHADVAECQRNVPNVSIVEADAVAVDDEQPLAETEAAARRPFGNLRDLMRKQ